MSIEKRLIMSANRRTNKKQNRLAFLSFILLFLLCMALVSYATYNAFHYVPEEADKVEGAKTLSEKERMETANRLGRQLDTIQLTLSALHQTGKHDLGRWQSLNLELQKLRMDFEKDASTIGIQGKGFQEIIFLAVKMDREIRDQKESLDKKTQELKECQREIQQMQQQMNALQHSGN
jgi:hypothetical protein